MALADHLLAEKTSLTALLEAEYPNQNLRDSLLGRLYTIRFLLGELGSAGGDIGTLVLAVFKATDAGTGYLLNDIIVLQQTPPDAPIYVNARTGSTITPDPADLGSVSSASNVTVATALPTGTNSIGQVTANAGTNLNTSALALEAGNLADIEAKIPSGITVTSNRVLVDGSGVTQPVDITSSVLPTGAATEITLDLIADSTGTDGGTTPSRIVLVGGKHDGITRPLRVDNQGHVLIAATGTQLAVDSISVTPASDSAFTLSAESGFLTVRNTALSNTAVAIKAAAGSVMGWNFINVNTVPVYVKFYNTAAASVTVGTTPILLTIAVPANSLNLVTPDLVPIEVFSTAISFACVTGLADNSTTAPSTAIHASVRYK